jgi:hypothetical protein
VQPILTWLAKPNNSSIILAIVLIDHGVIVTIAAIHNTTKAAETVNLAIGCNVYVLWIDHLLPHPVPLKMAPVMLKMRSVGKLHLRHSGAAISPSALMSRLIP